LPTRYTNSSFVPSTQPYHSAENKYLTAHPHSPRFQYPLGASSVVSASTSKRKLKQEKKKSAWKIKAKPPSIEPQASPVADGITTKDKSDSIPKVDEFPLPTPLPNIIVHTSRDTEKHDQPHKIDVPDQLPTPPESSTNAHLDDAQPKSKDFSKRVLEFVERISENRDLKTERRHSLPVNLHDIEGKANRLQTKLDRIIGHKSERLFPPLVLPNEAKVTKDPPKVQRPKVDSIKPEKTCKRKELDKILTDPPTTIPKASPEALVPQKSRKATAEEKAHKKLEQSRRTEKRTVMPPEIKPCVSPAASPQKSDTPQTKTQHLTQHENQASSNIISNSPARRNSKVRYLLDIEIVQ
jgi:hypothetical protein